jgi:hypothetical protein
VPKGAAVTVLRAVEDGLRNLSQASSNMELDTLAEMIKISVV